MAGAGGSLSSCTLGQPRGEQLHLPLPHLKGVLTTGIRLQEGDWVPGGLEFTSCENWPKEWDLNVLGATAHLL